MGQEMSIIFLLVTVLDLGTFLKKKKASLKGKFTVIAVIKRKQPNKQQSPIRVFFNGKDTHERNVLQNL